MKLSDLKQWFGAMYCAPRWVSAVILIVGLALGHCVHADQVYTCSDSGADGRAMSPWPNCATAAYADPVSTNVVASITPANGVAWRLASTLADTDQVYSQTLDKWVVKSTFSWTTPTTTSSAATTATSAAASSSTGTAAVSWAAVATATSYSVYSGSSATSLTKLADTTATSYTATGLAPGTWYFAVTASNSAGESAQSATVSKTIAAPIVAPPAPTGVTIAATPGYDLLKNNDSLTAKAVGTVPANTKCDTTQPALGLYRVPRASLVLAADVTTRPQVVLAKCG